MVIFGLPLHRLAVTLVQVVFVMMLMVARFVAATTLASTPKLARPMPGPLAIPPLIFVVTAPPTAYIMSVAIIATRPVLLWTRQTANQKKKSATRAYGKTGIRLLPFATTAFPNARASKARLNVTNGKQPAVRLAPRPAMITMEI